MLLCFPEQFSVLVAGYTVSLTTLFRMLLNDYDHPIAHFSLLGERPYLLRGYDLTADQT
jgi:hypothetical protein